MMVEEATILEPEKGLRLGDLHTTEPIGETETEREHYFECECGERFDEKDEAEAHLEEVRQ